MNTFIKKLLLVETQVPLCKTNQQENHLKNTGGKVSRNIAYRLYLRADKFKKRHKKAIVMKNNWKIKYLKLYEKYKKIKRGVRVFPTPPLIELIKI